MPEKDGVSSEYGRPEDGTPGSRRGPRLSVDRPLLVREKARFLVPLLVSFLSDVKVALRPARSCNNSHKCGGSNVLVLCVC